MLRLSYIAFVLDFTYIFEVIPGLFCTAKWLSCMCVYINISVQFSGSVMSDSLRPHEPQHIRLPCPSRTRGVDSDSYPLSRWCHPTISSSVIPFSSHLQSFPASGSFPVSQHFQWGGQRIVASASTSVLPMNTRDWFPLGWTGWISLQSRGPSRVFSNTTVQKHRFFSTQLSLWSNSHICTYTHSHSYIYMDPYIYAYIYIYLNIHINMSFCPDFTKQTPV